MADQYDDVAPYYDKVESYIGVFGTKENVPSAPDGIFMPPPKPRCTETIVKKACDKIGVTCIPSRLAVITQPHNGRPPCHYCAQCGRGCVSASNFSSSQVMIPSAEATGRFTLITHAMVREIVVGKDGKAEAASYIDKPTRTEKKVYAKAFVVGASACESARLLLNSKSAMFPDGLANSSGVVGRYLTDSVGSSAGGVFPQLAKMPKHNHDGVGGMHMYMPWWKFDRKNDFLRGYHIEFGGGQTMPGVGEFGALCDAVEGYGAGLKKTCRDAYGTYIGFAGRGEMIPNQNSYCEIDPDISPTSGGFQCFGFIGSGATTKSKWRKTCRRRSRRLWKPAGERSTRRSEPDGSNPYGIADGGVIIHELGCVRMGNNPKTSALNGYCQAHDVKNLFVTDAAVVCDQSGQEPDADDYGADMAGVGVSAG